MKYCFVCGCLSTPSCYEPYLHGRRDTQFIISVIILCGNNIHFGEGRIDRQLIMCIHHVFLSRCVSITPLNLFVNFCVIPPPQKKNPIYNPLIHITTYLIVCLSPHLIVCLSLPMCLFPPTCWF